MKHPNQTRNFFRHAELVGIGFAVFELVFDWITLAEIRYDDNGCMHTTSCINAD